MSSTLIVIPNKNHQTESGSILLPSSDRDGRTTENNWNNYKRKSPTKLGTGKISSGFTNSFGCFS